MTLKRSILVAIDLVDERHIESLSEEDGSPEFWQSVLDDLMQIRDSMDFNDGTTDAGQHIELHFSDETNVKEKIG